MLTVNPPPIGTTHAEAVFAAGRPENFVLRLTEDRPALLQPATSALRLAPLKLNTLLTPKP